MSDFLKKMKEAVESGKPNELIKLEFDQILTKADKLASNKNTLKEIEEKANKLYDESISKQKPLTKEEVEELNKKAINEQEKINRIDEMMMKNAKILILQREIMEHKQIIVDKENLIKLISENNDDKMV